MLPLSGARARPWRSSAPTPAPRPVTTGFGSSQVVAPFTSTPLSAIRHRAGRRAIVSYAGGGSTTGDLPPVPTDLLTPSSGRGHGLTLTLDPDRARRQRSHPPIQVSSPPSTPPSAPHPSIRPGTPPPSRGQRAGPAPHGRVLRAGIRLAVETRPPPPGRHRSCPAGMVGRVGPWTGTLTPPRSGLYIFSLDGSGGATSPSTGRPRVSDPLTHAHGALVADRPAHRGHHPYRLQLDWEPFADADATTVLGSLPSSIDPRMELRGRPDRRRPSPPPRRPRSPWCSPGTTAPRPSTVRPCPCPGDQNALISAVAAANPRTVVVLNTGGPVLMPWLDRVAGVIEAWYPGEEDGAAIAALLFGDVDPSGRLPVTFPASEAGRRSTPRPSGPASTSPRTTPRVSTSATGTTTPPGSARCSPSGSGSPTPTSPWPGSRSTGPAGCDARGRRDQHGAPGPGPTSLRRTSPIRRRPANRRPGWWRSLRSRFDPGRSRSVSLFVPAVRLRGLSRRQVDERCPGATPWRWASPPPTSR